jgi:hypothetical protein
MADGDLMLGDNAPKAHGRNRERDLQVALPG